MRLDTKRHFHFGVNFIVSPSPDPAQLNVLQFQQHLASPARGIVFDQTQRQGEAVVLGRTSPALEVRIGSIGPQVGQLLVTSSRPEGRIEDFIADAEELVAAYQQVWPQVNQVLRRDCTIRHLYASGEEHAFKYLWEKRLHQPESALNTFGRPIAGGGIRLVFPALTAEQPLIELKIESLLVDASELFVEAGMVWNQPVSGDHMNAPELLMTVEEFLNSQVAKFIAEDK
ncbi:MAG: hypothetical protein ACJ8AO_11190 [Gemmatimonadaceae bacterium]